MTSRTIQMIIVLAITLAMPATASAAASEPETTTINPVKFKLDRPPTTAFATSWGEVLT